MARVTAQFHSASAAEIDTLWPAIRAARLFESRDAVAAWLERYPWALRLNADGDAVVLMPWRPHLQLLHMRAAWCPRERVGGLCAEVRAVGEQLGLPMLLSPLLNASATEPYVQAGLTLERRLVSYTAGPESVKRCAAPPGVWLRPAEVGELDSITSLEESCFSQFWRHEREEIALWVGQGRVTVATDRVSVIGYTLTTLSEQSGTLSRVAVAPDMRGYGVGKALVSDAAAFLSRSAIRTLSLCTQESNDVSRAMYASLGLREHRERLVLAADPQPT
jgi:ribosomal protein S18 acetylase RimI-like enzyme